MLRLPSSQRGCSSVKIIRTKWKGGIFQFTNQLVRRSRSFHTAHALSIAHYKLNTSNDEPPNIPKDFKARSVMIATTPNMLYKAAEIFEKIHARDAEMQLILAAFDTVGKNSSRTGISQLWCDEYVTITDAKLADNIMARNDWRHEQGVFEFSVTDQLGAFNYKLPLANTLFTNDCFESLYIQQPKSLPFHECSQLKLKSISLELPNVAVGLDQQHHSSLQPLELKEKLVVTDCKHNMVKQINGKPASSILQGNEHLMSVITKETKIFAVLSKDGETRRYEVVGGGGSWGPKAKLLALSPEPNMFLPPGAEIKFYYLDGLYKKKLRSLNPHTGIVVECSTEEGVDIQDADQADFVDCFGVGSEKGFVMNDVRYNSNGESVTLVAVKSR